MKGKIMNVFEKKIKQKKKTQHIVNDLPTNKIIHLKILRIKKEKKTLVC